MTLDQRLVLGRWVMSISGSVRKAPAPGAGRFTLANLVLGPISLKFQHWTYVQDTSFSAQWVILEDFQYCMHGIMDTSRHCCPLSPTGWKLPWEGINPSHSGPVGGQRGKSRWTHLRQERCSGCMLHLHAAVHSTHGLRNIVQDLGGVLWQSALFFLLNFSKMQWVVSIQLQSSHFYFFMKIFGYTFDSHLASSCFSI